MHYCDESNRNKIIGCWLGKAVGGTLGTPYEGSRGPLSLDYYNPVPVDMLPNDDLDLQVLWAFILDQMSAPIIHRDIFAQAWQKHVKFPFDEYGVALRNLAAGIPAPFSGSYDNWFSSGLGAAIRSEIWACLAPGNPELAARYAYEDACVDHAGEGIYAEQFLAAIESMAFVENDIHRLLEAGLQAIPSASRLATAVRDTICWCAESTDWLVVRARILKNYGSENFTDVIMNLPFVILSLLLGHGDFARSICLAVNCGYDADCTGATVGAIMGIINPAGIEDRWLNPIGRKLIINDSVHGINHPATLDAFTDQIIRLRERLTVNTNATIESPASSWKPFTIEADCAVVYPWFVQDCGKFAPKFPAHSRKRNFSGHWGHLQASDIPVDGLYLMRFVFELPHAQSIRAMFNTPSISRVWIDGEYKFGRDGGRMSPSFHRAPKNQFADCELSAGRHELLAGVARLGAEAEIDWVIGVGDPKTNLWLPVLAV